jgi:hypothetical protein
MLINTLPPFSVALSPRRVARRPDPVYALLLYPPGYDTPLYLIRLYPSV